MWLKSLAGFVIDRIVKMRRPGCHVLHMLARRIVRAYQNNDVEMHSNGEHWLQSRLGIRDSVVAMDVGANQGEWVRGLLGRIPDAEVFCYEPVPSTFERLKSLIDERRANLNNFALSSSEGTLPINVIPDNSYLASAHEVSFYDPGLDANTAEVSARTGDQEIDRLELRHVDVLKVDTEGHDLDVLRGFQGALQAGRIDIIQFEYNILTLSAGRTLRDFFKLLSDRYLVCRLLPGGLRPAGITIASRTFGSRTGSRCGAA